MSEGRPFVGAVLVATLALSGTGCTSATTARMSSKALCENAGGTYVQGTCQPGTARKAQDMCLAYGGILIVNEDLCHIPVR